MKKEEARKLLDNTKVYVNGKSEEIQKKLFEIGYKWKQDGHLATCVTNTGFPFIYIEPDGYLACGDNMNIFTADEDREVSVDDILNIEIDKHDCSFKPYDRVLVRWREDIPWSAGIFSHEDKNKNQISLIGGLFTFERNNVKIIPYNSKTAHLIGTDKKYEEE